MAQCVEKSWYGKSTASQLMLPLSWLFRGVAAGRRTMYEHGVFRTCRTAVPVVVVGNITAGGTGKTPLTAWLVRELGRRGERPAMVSRGYRAKPGPQPVQVHPDSDPRKVGDEAILLAFHGEYPVVVHPDRCAAAAVAAGLGASVIVADDGLQHYRLQRDFEIALVDSARGFGNGRLLPAGPLREPVSRLRTVDAVLVHRSTADDGVPPELAGLRPLQFSLRPSAAIRLDGSGERPLDAFAGKSVHAVAGIAHPERFFAMLDAHDMKIHRHPLPDHADIEQADIAFGDELDVLMTDKDAVKCRRLDTRNCWRVPVEVEFVGTDAKVLLDQIMATFDREERPGS